MNALMLAQLALTLLEGVLAAVVKSGAPTQVIEAVKAAMASVQAVIDTEVTYGQLESLRANPQWDSPPPQPQPMAKPDGDPGPH